MLYYVIVELHHNEFQYSEHDSVAQLDRAFDYESKGRRFESCRGHHRYFKGFTSFRKALFFVFIAVLQQPYNNAAETAFSKLLL